MYKLYKLFIWRRVRGSIVLLGLVARRSRPIVPGCGASKTKPFCDGSHNEIAFDTTPDDDRTKDRAGFPFTD